MKMGEKRKMDFVITGSYHKGHCDNVTSPLSRINDIRSSFTCANYVIHQQGSKVFQNALYVSGMFWTACFGQTTTDTHDSRDSQHCLPMFSVSCLIVSPSAFYRPFHRFSIVFYSLLAIGSSALHCLPILSIFSVFFASPLLSGSDSCLYISVI